ncbi:MAG: sulfurtransferase-like selenium metabolism protein YedF [Atopobiaceae bacterium]
MEIDARNLKCPKPVVLTLEALPKLKDGESLDILVNDNVALSNLMRLAASKKLDFYANQQGADTVIKLVPRADSEIGSDAAEKEAQAFCDVPAAAPAAPTVIAVDTDSMGRGNDELGHILMKGFIYALAHQEKVPDTMLFYNGGAHLTCEGSESLDDIKELESRGTKILTCGTCLDFYGIKDKLAVGEVTNLYAIAEIVSGCAGVTVL